MLRPIRVAQVVGKMVGGGVEAVVMNYYRTIDRSKIQFDFLVNSDSNCIPMEEIESLGGRVFVIPSYQHLISYRKELRRLFETERWPIVHSHVNTLSVFPLGVATKTGVPVRIAHSHSTSGRGEYTKNFVKNVLRKFSNTYPTHRLACSESAGRWLFGNDADFNVLNNAIDLKSYGYSADTRDEIRDELGIGENDIAFGHIGRYATQKNHSFLLKVFSQFAQDQRNAVLILIGDGPLKPEIEREIQTLSIGDRTFVLGQREDASRLYQAFDVFLLPSLYEGLGMVGIEAQASGLPCIFSECVPSEVMINQNCCFLPIEDSDAVEWVSKMHDFSSMKRCEVIYENFAEYDIGHAVKSLESLYENAIKDKDDN